MRTSHLVALMVMSFVCACSKPSNSTVAAWQRNMNEAILPGYTHFLGHWVNSDTAAYIFSYSTPLGMTTADAFDALKKRIPNFYVHEQTDHELVLRRDVTYSGPGGFDEWRFIHDEPSRCMTVLYANLDSPVERDSHDAILRTLRRFHSEASHRSTEQPPA
ncbi:MAG: hypothetical protein A2283_13605 [Lentisphaerae bacterium RIFOXYA12_FULL_48_11]|nr:MAG: hypothetical protein A2283_13605 [Lentisphaerae bacterium RIFOXYA12_FULL_48_11]